MRPLEQRKDDVAPRVHVVRDEQQLAEPRLAEILRQQIHVAASEIRARGRIVDQPQG